MTNTSCPTEGYRASPDPDALILETKARILALPTKKDDGGADYIEVVAFLLANETYGVETAYVSEVNSIKELTPLPCTPPFVAGIINVHGQVFSVIDIKLFFELPAKGLSDLNKVVIIGNGDMAFGILTDAVLDVRRIPRRDLQPALPTLTGIRKDYLRGISRDRLIVLDAFSLLTDPRIIINEVVE